MNAVLIYPEWPDTYWSFKHELLLEGKRCAYPPLGQLTISPLLPKGWSKRLVDINVRPLTEAGVEWSDEAMTLAVMGFHFQVLTRQICNAEVESRVSRLWMRHKTTAKCES
jgi:hypothetical protein